MGLLLGTPVVTCVEQATCPLVKVGGVEAEAGGSVPGDVTPGDATCRGADTTRQPAGQHARRRHSVGQAHMVVMLQMHLNPIVSKGGVGWASTLMKTGF